jgi:Kef-type K+ transport system membrane component KefB
VNAVPFLLGLLLVAYLGSQLMSGKSAGIRLASGAEYLLLGLVLGPYVFGTVERSTLRAFEPVTLVGSAWFTLVVGVEFGYRDQRRVGLRGLLTGLVLAALTAAGAAVLVYVLAPRFVTLSPRDHVLLAGGAGLVASETTRHAARWSARTQTGGRLTTLVADLADSDDLVPILAVAALLPEAPHAPISAPFWAWGLITIAIGIVLGATAAALLRSELRASDGWGVLIGAVLLATGIAWRLGLSPLAATFALGVSIVLFSRHGAELRTMIGRSEHAVLLPTLLLAGASVQVHSVGLTLALVGLLFAVRVAVRVAASPVVVKLAGAPSRAALPLGFGLGTSGALSVAVGLALASRFPGTVGDTILAVAIGLVLLELVGPRFLRQALVRAGEIEELRGGAEAPEERAAEIAPEVPS